MKFIYFFKKIKSWLSIRSRINRFFRQRKIKLIQRQYPEGSTQIVQASVCGIKMRVLAGDNIGRDVLAFGQYEELDTNFIRGIVKSNWVCFDVGANIGYWSLLLAGLCTEGEIHSFEPSPVPFSVLKDNIALNKYTNVRTNDVAMSNKPDKVRFFVSRDTGFSSLKDTSRKVIRKKIEVSCTTLDEYVLKNNVNKIDFLKIDIEGAEKLMLTGATDALKSRKLKLIFIELINLNLSIFNESVESVVLLLKSFGYSPFVVDGKLNELRPFEKKDYDVIYNVYFKIV